MFYSWYLDNIDNSLMPDTRC